MTLLSKPGLAMFAVAAVGVSAIAGYGIYKVISGRNQRRKIREAVDAMIAGLDKTNIYLKDPVGVREKLQRMYEAGTEKLQIISDFDKTLTKYTLVNGLKGCSVHGVIETSKHFPESYREKALALKNKYHPIELSSMSAEEKGPLMEEWWTKAHELILDLNLRKENLEVIVRDADIALRDGVEWLFVKSHENKVPILILSGGLADIIKVVIDQQSELYDNVEIVGNYMKYNSQGVMDGFQGGLISSNNKHEMTKNLPYFQKTKNRPNAIVMGDLIQDTDVVSSIPNPGDVLTIGFLNEKVDERLDSYTAAFDVVIVDDHSIQAVDVVLMQLFHMK
ncbi:cytosolic 5'-nucleotidase 3 [Exaiptasia diaphana]|uniref:5'-nucleotidase n=1 Tax=Exaiptasia diaphana TaxID=2652724 RepID=A0A913XWT0_EXADI|nr:cytosolic 5'-nucleotidase 3 [Exaiptasia diaphana]KXJ08759.1 Cytosolic 5'-nucleotidase 3A [Exaiptasia diaphana]